MISKGTTFMDPELYVFLLTEKHLSESKSQISHLMTFQPSFPLHYGNQCLCPEKHYQFRWSH
ncbi:hypothetical protein Tsubulata_050046 [Turnera subulata]|uniref:Uncharacterized protein n=1 Tax=Turnera subulata TaxID=218843 RepID=A0A9Q0G1B0_9ROSI|nr:hypothetical protein Tsubulata_050046 [Turnera subulata]